MLTKERLIVAAKEAKANKEHVYILNSNSGLQIINKPISEYSTEEVAANDSIIKVLQPDSVLKFDCSSWKLKDVSIDSMIDGINKEFAKFHITATQKYNWRLSKCLNV